MQPTISKKNLHILLQHRQEANNSRYEEQYYRAGAQDPVCPCVSIMSKTACCPRKAKLGGKKSGPPCGGVAKPSVQVIVIVKYKELLKKSLRGTM